MFYFTRTDMEKEIKIMSRLNDTNIVSLVGVCTKDEPYLVVMEYMKYGDLKNFLQQHRDNKYYPTMLRYAQSSCFVTLLTKVTHSDWLKRGRHNPQFTSICL